jgi:hypothetical protein
LDWAAVLLGAWLAIGLALAGVAADDDVASSNLLSRASSFST